MRCSAKPGLIQRLVRRKQQGHSDRERLDWLTRKIRGSEARRIIGVINDTSNKAEWRRAIDRAMDAEPLTLDRCRKVATQ